MPIRLTTLSIMICCLTTANGADPRAPLLADSIEELPPQTALPELMLLHDGDVVRTLDQWTVRREELRQIMLHYQYGSMPPRPDRVSAVNWVRRDHESGKGHVESLTLRIESKQQPHPLDMRLLAFVPPGEGPFPVIIREEGTLNGNDFVPTLLDHGYMFIEYARHDLDPDRKGVEGVAQQAYPDHDWATLAVWAWGGMRVVDYLETRADVDIDRIAITGHSRGGKMALLAGAMDERIALVVPVQSGAGGAGCYTLLGPGAESLEMNDKPHWYADRILMFHGRTDRLPFDQHFLKALVAPRALLCIESVDDDYANPVGTQLTTIAAEPAFALYGEQTRYRNALTYRNGKHSFNASDWQRLLAFAEWHFRGRKPSDPESYQARPYDLPEGCYAADDATKLQKGIAQERVPQDSQAALGHAGFAKIGNPNNPPAEDYFGMGRFGAVKYEFEIACRQTTNREYAEFLNAIAASPSSDVDCYVSDMEIRRHQEDGQLRYSVSGESADRAVTHVSWTDAIRYCNWLHHGKPTVAVGPATTESGAYVISADGRTALRQPLAKFALPSDHEWFKAAYYDPAAGYRLYEQNEQGGLEVIRYNPAALSKDGVSGLYDRLWEWNEDRVNQLFRSVRSGAWFVGNNRQAAGRLYSNPALRLPNIGFRVVRLQRNR